MSPFKLLRSLSFAVDRREIGKLPETAIPPVGESLMLAGKRWQVREIIFDKKLVLVTSSPGKRLRPFGSVAGEIHTSSAGNENGSAEQRRTRISDQNGEKLLRAARQTARVVSLDKTDVCLAGKTSSGFRGLARAQCGRFRFLARSAKIAHETDRLSITYHLSSPRKNCVRISVKSPSPSRMQLRLPDSCRIKPSKNSMISPPNSCWMKRMHEADWTYRHTEQRAKHYWPEIEIKTAFRWLRRADAEIGAPLLDAALSRKSTFSLPSGRANIPLPPSRMQLDAASAQAAPEIALSAGAALHKLPV